MNHQEITDTINRQILNLKNEINEIPGGGGIENLKRDLQNIQRSIGGLIQDIDEVYYTLTGLDPNRF